MTSTVPTAGRSVAASLGGGLLRRVALAHLGRRRGTTAFEGLAPVTAATDRGALAV
jgi:hypothetical protein